MQTIDQTAIPWASLRHPNVHTETLHIILATLVLRRFHPIWNTPDPRLSPAPTPPPLPPNLLLSSQLDIPPLTGGGESSQKRSCTQFLQASTTLIPRRVKQRPNTLTLNQPTHTAAFFNTPPVPAPDEQHDDKPTTTDDDLRLDTADRDDYDDTRDPTSRDAVRKMLLSLF